MSIYFHKESVSIEFNEDLVSNWINSCIGQVSKITGDLSVIFCNDEYLKTINIKYLNHDYYTDIITFDYSEKDTISGDLFISIDRVIENAKLNNVHFINELYRVIIHGVLHLCGYNDKTVKEKKEIREKENFFLNIIV
ncbi:MAG: rRNA maturation RNase YbeY [Parvicellaceae bacterium]